MAGRERAPDMDVQEVEFEGGEEMDAEVQQGDCVEVKFDSDEDVAPESDDDVDDMPGEEMGTVEEDEVYGEDVGGGSLLPEADDSLAHVTHAESVLSCAFSPADRRVLLTGGQDDCGVLWLIEEDGPGRLKMSERFRLAGHTDSVSQAAFSNDGKYAATASYDGTVKIWDPASGALLHTLDGPSKEVEWILWHPKGHAILAGSADTMAWMWWAPTGKLMQIFAGHAQSVTCGAWGLGGKLIVTGSMDRNLIVWNPRAGTPQQTVREVHENSIVAMCSHPEAPLVVTGSEDATARVVQIETGKVVANLPGHTESVEAIAFNHAGPSDLSLLATASMDGKVLVWDGKTFDLRCTMKDHVGSGGVVRFKWLPQSAYSAWLCTCATDGTVRIFNALAGQCLHKLRGHADTVLDLDLAIGDAPAGGAVQMAVASASDDKSCRIFTVALGDAAAGAAAAAAAASPAAAAPAAGSLGSMEAGMG